MSKDGSKPHNIGSGEYQIVAISSMDILTTIGLGSDIAFTAYAPLSGKAALARNINRQKTTELFNMLTDNTLQMSESAAIEIRLIGGDSSAGSRDQVDHLVDTLKLLERGKDIFHIIHSDILDKKIYDSVQFFPLSNSLEPYIVTTPLATPKSILPSEFQKNKANSTEHSR